MVVRIDHSRGRSTSTSASNYHRRSTQGQFFFFVIVIFGVFELIFDNRKAKDITSGILDAAVEAYAILPTILDTSKNTSEANGASSASTANDKKKNENHISWPQVDDRIAEALRNGHSINPKITYTDDTKREYTFNNSKYEAPVEKLATVVTCIYEARTKHPGQYYQEWFSNMLHITDPLIIFLNPNLDPWTKIDWVELARSRRQHAPTIIAKLPFNNLTMESQFDEKFWLQQLPPPYIVKKQMGYRVYNEKILLIKEVAIQNPFDTELFVWVDAGYFRGAYKPVPGVIVRNNITKNGIAPNKVLFPQMYKEPAMQEVAANVWGGTKEAILETNEKYWLSFWDMVTKGLSVCYEQRVMITMCRTWPDLCFLFYSGIDDDWFGLGKKYIRDPKFDFRKYEYPVHVDGGNPDNIRAKSRDTILPTTIVNGTVVFPEGVVTGDSIAKYYTRKVQ